MDRLAAVLLLSPDVRRRLPGRLDHRGLPVLGLAATQRRSRRPVGALGGADPSRARASGTTASGASARTRSPRASMRLSPAQIVLIVQGGINDIARVGRSSLQRRDAAHARRSAGSLSALGGRRVRRAAVEQRLAAARGADPRAQRADLHALDVPLLRVSRHARGSANGPGRMKADWCNDDGDHPSLAGYRRLGEVAFRRSRRCGLPSRRWLCSPHAASPRASARG